MRSELEETYAYAVGRCKRTLMIAFGFGLIINLFDGEKFLKFRLETE